MFKELIFLFFSYLGFILSLFLLSISYGMVVKSFPVAGVANRVIANAVKI